MNANHNKKFITLFFMALLATSVIYSGCKREKAKKVSLFKDREETEISNKEDAIKVAIGGMVSPRRTLAYYKQLLDYLSKKMGNPIILLQRKSYGEINDLLGRGEVKFAFICAGPYVEAHEKFGVELLVVPVVKGKTHYFSYIIVHKDSKINSFEELQGKPFAFMDPLSLTGTIFPTYLLTEKGYTPQEYFERTFYTHSHDNSILAVAEKLADGAAAHSLVYDYLAETDPEFTSQTKIILKSPPFGIPPVVVPKNLDTQLKEQLRGIFLNLHKEKESKEILGRLMIDRFVIGDDASYDKVRQIKRSVETIP